MHPLIIHHEAEYFAGAEKMLGYFLQGLASLKHPVTVAAVQESRVPSIIPSGISTCWIPRNSQFSLVRFWRQAMAIRRLHQTEPFDLIHGWAARDWELTALAGLLTGRPTLGTLHDHPRAQFLSRGRQRLMAGASTGLNQVVCVSEAVRLACQEAGYRRGKLTVIQNGLPLAPLPRGERPGNSFRCGFLGLFSERKGLRGLFQIIDEVSHRTNQRWEMVVAGDAQDQEGKKLVTELRESFSGRSWWPRVQWCGWVKRPDAFLSGIDLLICPSSEFDPFPTVLLEAGAAGVAVLAARVGGVPEIVEDGETGWLFEPQAWSAAAVQLNELLERPELVRDAGLKAKKRVERQFEIGRMVAEYWNVYAGLAELK